MTATFASLMVPFTSVAVPFASARTTGNSAELTTGSGRSKDSRDWCFGTSIKRRAKARFHPDEVWIASLKFHL